MIMTKVVEGEDPHTCCITEQGVLGVRMDIRQATNKRTYLAGREREGLAFYMWSFVKIITKFSNWWIDDRRGY